MSLLDIIYNHFQKKKNSVQKKDSEESTYYFTPYTEVSRKQYIEEPITFASEEFKTLFKSEYKLHSRNIANNQWINPIQGINYGLGSANLSSYLYQPVNYPECMVLAQDPLMSNIFDILTNTPMSKGGRLIPLNNENIEYTNYIEDKTEKEFQIIETLQEAIKNCFIFGGCLVYMDFGDTDYLEQPVNENNYTKFRGFRIIDPSLCCVAEVNTIDTLSDDFMEPEKWYIKGKGIIHSSRFIKFEWNVPPASMKPMCMYFGMPLTQLIKQDIANANLVTQGLANLVNDVRKTFLKTDIKQYASNSLPQVLNRFRVMEQVGNNHRIFPIGFEEDIIQLNTSLNNYQGIVETFFNAIACKTGIPRNKLTGASTGGLNANTSQVESDKNFIDKIETIRQSLIKDRLIKMYQVASTGLDGDAHEFDYEFNSLSAPTTYEITVNTEKNIDIAIKLKQLGIDDKECISWLQNNKILNLEELSGEK